ncbi:MAG: hypothetical protein KF754_15930 [Planctomycetes bacterium]|nr:hypothetical protein [Planctomycetota bacterium]
MDTRKTAIAALMGLVSAVVLFWLMDMNFLGWLGAWFAAKWAAWLVGALIAVALGFGYAALWSGVVAKQPITKKLSPPGTGALYGVVVGLVTATLVPLLLSAMAGDPGMGHSTGTGFDAIPGAFGVHLVPELPDLGFKPPLRSLAERDWISRNDHGNRLLPFALAFAAFGATLGMFAGRSK